MRISRPRIHHAVRLCIISPANQTTTKICIRTTMTRTRTTMKIVKMTTTGTFKPIQPRNPTLPGAERALWIKSTIRTNPATWCRSPSLSSKRAATSTRHVTIANDRIYAVMKCAPVDGVSRLERLGARMYNTSHVVDPSFIKSRYLFSLSLSS